MSGDSRVLRKGSVGFCSHQSDISSLPVAYIQGDSMACMATFRDTCTSLGSWVVVWDISLVPLMHLLKMDKCITIATVLYAQRRASSFRQGAAIGCRCNILQFHCLFERTRNVSV